MNTENRKNRKKLIQMINKYYNDINLKLLMC